MALIMKTASIILAAGRGSRMKGYTGNKTLLPLLPGSSCYEGRHPILMNILANLPTGPRALVVNHRKDEVIRATRDLDLAYHEQPELNGTGGALIAAFPFLETRKYDRLIVTMGDVPFVRRDTYLDLVGDLKDHALMVLGFRPKSRKQYGLLETRGDQVERITEWKYWRKYPEKRLRNLSICNSGIYAADREAILSYLPVLASRPHMVEKVVQGRPGRVKEYFITDLIEYMRNDGLSVGYIVAHDEEEVMGIDDPDALKRAQEIYRLGRIER
ncbi:MAG TPA: MobA-like NTP transferase domain containing protein [Deltaproteobacteria bacterium]|nr:MobA-like NTP transferase domain containing protein [Deltaproteobacteria bacterium]